MKKKLELYFHIPFCVRKCFYCDFLSAPADPTTREAYMKALIREVAERAADYREYRVDTVFIGGGTPSLVDGAWIGQLMDTVRTFLAVSEDAEITIEVNPGTVDGEKLACYVNAGINRLSIGLQSADDGELGTLGRIHTWADFLKTYRQAREAGFANINVDVMSALPGQSVDSYCRTLERISGLSPQPEHISAYSLIVEEGTPFAEWKEKGLLFLPDEDSERLMYEKTEEILGREGFQRYEISNYAKEGYACRHNCGYWRRTDYLGFGTGAASLIGNTRFQNGSSLVEYLKNPAACRSDVQELSVSEQMEEFLFLGLRMTEGVSEQDFLAAFGRTLEEVYAPVIRKNMEDGLLQYCGCPEEGGRRLALTKRGMDISNYVMAQFLFG